MIRKISVAALCLTAVVAIAQGAAPPVDAKRMDRMALLLDLDAGQKVAVEQILQERRDAMGNHRKEMRESDQRPTREEMHAQLTKQHAELIEKLRPILSDLQLRKFEALREDGPGARRGPGRDMHMGPQGDDKK